jgi:hypothetical protein
MSSALAAANAANSTEIRSAVFFKMVLPEFKGERSTPEK